MDVAGLLGHYSAKSPLAVAQPGCGGVCLDDVRCVKLPFFNFCATNECSFLEDLV
jgi:hypothetical protein